MVLAEARLPSEAHAALPSVAAWPTSLRALYSPLPAEVWDWPKDTPSTDVKLPEHRPEPLYTSDLKFMPESESGAPCKAVKRVRGSMPQLPTEVWRRPDPDELSEASAEECLSGDEGAVALGKGEGGDKRGAGMADSAASELVWELSRRQEQGSLRMASRAASPVCVLHNHLTNASPGPSTTSSCSPASPQSRPPAGPCCLHRQRQKRCPHAFLAANHAGAAALGAAPRADGGSQALAPATPCQGEDSVLVTERSVAANLKAAVLHGAGDPMPAPAELGGWGADQFCVDRTRAAETRAVLLDSEKLAPAPMELSGKVAELGGSCCGDCKGLTQSGGPTKIMDERFASIKAQPKSGGADEVMQWLGDDIGKALRSGAKAQHTSDQCHATGHHDHQAGPGQPGRHSAAPAAAASLELPGAGLAYAAAPDPFAANKSALSANACRQLCAKRTSRESAWAAFVQLRQVITPPRVC